jgi:predicted GNAT family acetyltransferase
VTPKIRHDRSAREFSTDVDGHRAVLNYNYADHVMTIVHTGVPEAIAGRGVAQELMRAALNAARAEGWKVSPKCSYAAAFMLRHTEYADLSRNVEPANSEPDAAAKKHVDELLDEALEESFPASDVPSIIADR